MLMRNYDGDMDTLTKTQKQQVEKNEAQQGLEMRTSGKKIKMEQVNCLLNICICVCLYARNFEKMYISSNIYQRLQGWYLDIQMTVNTCSIQIQGLGVKMSQNQVAD